MGSLSNSRARYDRVRAKLVKFVGSSTEPPKESGSDADIKNLVAQNPNLVGYVDASAVDASVKVVYKF